MGSADEAVVLAFNAAINRGDLPGLGRLMADDHRFIDTAGNTFAGKPACLEAWRGFFASFPDYRNVFDNVHSNVHSGHGGIVEVHGRSECSVAALSGPARWRAVVADGLVVEWRVFDATGLD
jgi:ketosteroid isomerase-like protein